MMTKALDLQLFSQEEPQQIPEPKDEQVDLTDLHSRFQAHIQELERQAAQLKAIYPQLDLHRELRNPVFARMTAPNVGLSVEDAYCAVHRKELQAAAVLAAKLQVSNAIATGAVRPQEHGLTHQAGTVSTFDYRHATKEQREDLKKQIRQAAAEGKRIYPVR